MSIENISVFFCAFLMLNIFVKTNIIILKDALRIVPYFVFTTVGAKRTSTGCSAPCRGGSLSHKTTLVQAHRGFRLLTLASLYSIRNDANESLCYRKSNSFRLGITKIYLLFYHKIVNFARACLKKIRNCLF